MERLAGEGMKTNGTTKNVKRRIATYDKEDIAKLQEEVNLLLLYEDTILLILIC